MEPPESPRDASPTAGEPSDGARAKEIFFDALELTGAAREAFLARACGDAAMRERVDRLLSGAEREDGFLSGVDLPAQERPGTTMGPYTLVKLLGEGGFGSVFLADQAYPVKRQVALKIIKLGMDTRQVVARFEQERQALAVMDHPNIARVFDAGATETGRPYFVMELVSGRPITEFCDGARLSVPARIELFVQVCAGVQHAHSKGIIHRDIKPSNVIVSLQDGKPLAKIIDFGIARASDRAAAEKAAFTEARQFIGTPEYVSPEQAEGSRDIDTRTDVYSLGVLLYELLAGLPPFDPRTLRAAAYAELQRIIRDVEPPTPSARLSRIGGDAETLATVAAVRGIDPARLPTLLRGELDWIVMRSLEKDRSRRYESPSALAADLRRYLEGRAVEAAPPSRVYRIRKAVRRNRGAVAAGAGVLGALVIGLSGALWQASVARRERDAAREATGIAEAARAQAQAASAAAEKARAEEATRSGELEQMAQFQASQLGQVVPREMGARIAALVEQAAKGAWKREGADDAEIAKRSGELERMLKDANFTDVALGTLRQNIFEPARKTLDEQFRNQPRLRAGLMLTLAETQRDLGMMDEAEALQREGLAAYRTLLGNDYEGTINAIGNLAGILRSQGKYAEAETLARETIERARAREGDTGKHVVRAMQTLGLVLQAQGKSEEADQVFKQSLDARVAADPDSADTLAALANYAIQLYSQGKLEAAAEAMGRAADGFVRLKGPESYEALRINGNLASIEYRLGRVDAAEQRLRGILKAQRAVHGDESDEALGTAFNLSVLLQEKGDLDGAIAMAREVLAARRKALPPTHPELLRTLRGLGVMLRAASHYEEAEALLRECLTGRTTALGEGHPDTLDAMAELGAVLTARGRPAEAEALLRTAVEGATGGKGAPRERWAAAAWGAELGAALSLQGKFEEADEELTAAREDLMRIATAPKPWTHRSALLLAQHYERWNAAAASDAVAAKAARWKAIAAAGGTKEAEAGAK